MTTDEIRALVAQKIAGQGSAVDVGGGLPTILNAICDALDAVPAPVVVPDWVNNVPVVEETGSISEAEFIAITNSGIFVHEGKAYVISSETSINAIFPQDWVDGVVFVNSQFYSDTGVLNSAHGFLAYKNDHDDFFLVEIDI